MCLRAIYLGKRAHSSQRLWSFTHCEGLPRESKSAALSLFVKLSGEDVESWLQSARHMLLASQIARFEQLVRLGLAAEAPLREKAVSTVCAAVRAALPGARIEPFGSSVTGLMLPKLSDLDLVAFHKGANPRASLSAVASEMLKRKLVCQGSPLLKLTHKSVRVPIVRFRERTSGVQFDVSVNELNGLRNTRALIEQLGKHAEVTPVILLLKAFLHQHRWQSTQQGGVGSYLLYAMVIQMVREDAAASRATASELLALFFRTYGKTSGLRGLTDPLNGSQLTGAAHPASVFRFSEIARGFAATADELARRECLSAVLRGWPEGGLLSSQEELGLLMDSTPQAPRARMRKKRLKLAAAEVDEEVEALEPVQKTPERKRAPNRTPQNGLDGSDASTRRSNPFVLFRAAYRKANDKASFGEVDAAWKALPRAKRATYVAQAKTERENRRAALTVASDAVDACQAEDEAEAPPRAARRHAGREGTQAATGVRRAVGRKERRAHEE